MKRFLILILILALCLAGCKDKQRADIPGAEKAPEGVDWKAWELYTPYQLKMGEETLDVLIALDEIHLAIYYDKEEQELLGSVTILTPLSDVEYSRQRLRIMDVNGDGYDDISIPDMLPNGDRMIDCWLWDAANGVYLYAPEYSQMQEGISTDISWRDGKTLVQGVRDVPEGTQNLLFWIDGQTIHIYLDQREEKQIASVMIPEPLSEEAKAEVSVRSFWDCRDMNGDGWGDLQLPYRWEESNESVYVYAHCWIWDPQGETYIYDPARSREAVV